MAEERYGLLELARVDGVRSEGVGEHEGGDGGEREGLDEGDGAGIGREVVAASWGRKCLLTGVWKGVHEGGAYRVNRV